MAHAYRNVFGLDLETDWSSDNTEAWVVQWALSDGKDEEVGHDHVDLRDLFLRYLLTDKTYFFYIHNLNWDWEFFKYSVFNLMEGYGCEVTLNRRLGNMITCTMKMEGHGSIQFRDSSLKMPGALYLLARTIGMEKLEGFLFYAGWSEDVDMTDPENWRYVKMDARIVATAMRALHKEGYNKSTSSGDCWMDAKRTIRDIHGKNFWKNHFPRLSMELDKLLRRAYKGGINISQHRGYIEAQICHDDINGMYSAVMRDYPLPYGMPIVTDQAPENPDTLYVVKCRIKLQLKEGRIPWFVFGNHVDADMEGIKPTDPVESCYHFHDMTLTSVDVSLLSDFYDIETDPESEPLYWCWAPSVGIFKEYIAKWQTVKRESKGSDPLMYQKAKLMLNGLYGRFALNPEGERTEMYYDEGEDDLAYRTSVDVQEDMDAYLPYALFITAWARAILLEHVTLCGDANVIHCDTDSVIHLGGPAEGADYGPDLGQWDIEQRPVAMYEGGFKRYIEVLRYPITHERDLSVACAGVPQRTDPHHDDVPIGMWVELLDNPALITTAAELGHEHYRIVSQWLRDRYISQGLDPDDVDTRKLIPETVRGGRVLIPRTHKLSDNMRTRFRCRL